jgi:hypothetical protein
MPSGGSNDKSLRKQERGIPEISLGRDTFEAELERSDQHSEAKPSSRPNPPEFTVISFNLGAPEYSKIVQTFCKKMALWTRI